MSERRKGGSLALCVVLEGYLSTQDSWQRLPSCLSTGLACLLVLAGVFQPPMKALCTLLRQVQALP